MTDSPEPTPAMRVRGAFSRKDLASERFRATVARLMGITESEGRALFHLAQRSLTPGELRHLLLLSSGGISGLVARLEGGGHITRCRSPHDGRSYVLVAADDSLDAAQAHFAELVAEVDVVIGELSPQQQALLADVLERIASLHETHAEAAADKLVDQRRAAMPPVFAPGLWA